MSQITLPWTEKNAETLRGFRRKAIAQLLILGVAFLGIFAVFCLWLEPGNADRLADWKIVPVWLGVIGAALAGLGLLAGGVAVISYRTIGAVLRLPYFAFGLFIGAVVSICLIAWAHSWLFDFIQKIAPGSESYQIAVVEIGYDYAVADIFAALVDRGLGAAILAYAIWPLQFGLLRDIVALAGIIGFISIIPLFGIWWERKVAARIQSRMGPMRVGCWHGWLQSPADGLKLIFKEDLVPAEGDPILFRLAPYITFIPPLLAFIALPFAGAWVFRDLDVALIFILAMLGIEVLGVILAGWASNNKWSVYGAMREACQMVSYEIPMGMSLLIPIMMAGTLRLTDIADAQSGGFWNWYVFSNPWCFIAFFTYYIASLASCKRAPFDLPEAESELVAGFHTEYSGFRWSLFFFGEYVAMFAVSGLAVILFLGGWASPLPTDWAPTGSGFVASVIRGLLFEGPILFILKSAMLYFVQLWLRWTLPRIRIDQVLYACVQVLLPLTMVVLLANTIWLLGLDHLQWQWLIVLNTVLHWVLVAIGVVAVLSMIAVMAYGFVNNRRLVGKLAVDALPGA